MIRDLRGSLRSIIYKGVDQYKLLLEENERLSEENDELRRKASLDYGRTLRQAR
jgi:hypothetical protein